MLHTYHVDLPSFMDVDFVYFHFLLDVKVNSVLESRINSMINKILLIQNHGDLWKKLKHMIVHYD